MRYLWPTAAAAAAMNLCTSASAAILTASPSTFAAVFASARSGDTVRLTTGTYGKFIFRDRSFTTPVTIDARSARFVETLTFKNVNGLTLRGGTYVVPNVLSARAISITDGVNIAVYTPVVTGFASTQGVIFTRGRNLTVNDGSFRGLKVGIGYLGVDGGTLLGNRFTRMTSDGIQIGDSRNIRASFNNCSDTRIQANAHPDCIQLWSVAGHTPQNNIELSDNVAVGPTQGFTSFNGSAGGGDRIKMLRNRIDTSYPQGIACYECRDSVITDNVLTTLVDAQHRTSLNVVGGARNTVARNSIAPHDNDDGSPEVVETGESDAAALLAN